MLSKEKSLQHLKNSNSSPTEVYGIRIPEWDESNGGLSQIFTVLRRRVAVIASVAAVVTTATLILSWNRPIKYEGKFQLLVEPLKSSDSEIEATKQNNTILDYGALMEVLRSPKLMTPAIKKLQNRYPDITYDRLVGSGNVTSGAEGALAITRITKGKNESRVIEVRYRDSDPQKIQFVLDQVSQAYRTYSLQQQQTNLRQGVKFTEAQIPKVRLQVAALQGQMQSFQQQYGLFNPDLQSEQLLKRYDAVETQRLDTEKRLIEAESLYASLQSQVGMQQNAAIAASALSEAPQYQQLLARVQEVEAKLATESARFSEESPAIQDLRQQRASLLPLLDREAQKVLGVSSAINPQSLAFQNSVRRQLIQQLADTANQIQLLQAGKQTTIQTEGLLNAEIKQFPALARQYTSFQRDLQVNNETLKQLLTKQEALRLDAAQQEIPWELIMPPTVPRDQKGQLIPVSAGLSHDLVLGGIAGLLLGILSAFAVEKLRNVFYSSEEVKGATKLPLLGVIPFNQEFKQPVFAADAAKLDWAKPQKLLFGSINSQPDKSFLEAFRSLHTKIQFLSLDTPIRSLAVTSATAGDGKSTVAIHLARIAAEAGQRVLLVDANLRHPQLYLRLGLSNQLGLSDVLSRGLDPTVAIQQPPSEENLFVLTSGEPVENPIRLFSLQKIKCVLEELQTHFDFVIYDTPPFLDSPDSNLIAVHTDGMLLVVGLGKTGRPVLRQALNESKASRIPVLGTVANGVER